MKRQSLYFLTCLYLGFSASGCGNDIATPEAGDGLVPITFSSGIITNTSTDVQTKATTDFPNSGSIAILAAKGSSAGAQATDWTPGHLLLNHEQATAGTKNADNSYPVNVNAGTKYWPFSPAEYLTFAAYSPLAGNALSVDTDNKTLKVDISTDKTFPDLLYTIPVGPFNKEDGKSTVSLGEFRHAMSKLVVKVIPVDRDGKTITNTAGINVKVIELRIDTKVTSGTFSFTNTNPVWTPGSMQADYRTVYTLINSTTALPYTSSAEYYLLPDTQTLSRIYLKINDIVDTEYANYTINQFKSTSNTGVTLEAGKITTLTIKLEVVDVETGEDPRTFLEGTLTDWVYKGNSEVEIE